MELIFALQFFVPFIGCARKFREALRGQSFEPTGLGEEGSPQPFSYFAFADDAGERSNGAGTAGETNVRMLALGEDVSWDDSPCICRGQLYKLRFTWRLFVEHCLKGGFFNDFDEEAVFRTVEFSLDFVFRLMPTFQKPFI